MKRLVFPAIFIAVALFGCDGNSPMEPDIPLVPDKPDDIVSPQCAGEEAVTATLNQAPEYGTMLRAGQVIQLAVDFTLPLTAYPTSLDLGLVFPNKLGGVTGISCGVVRREHRMRDQRTDSVECTMTISEFSFGDPKVGVAGPVDVFFKVFNWDHERHDCDLDYYRRFSQQYIYKP